MDQRSYHSSQFAQKASVSVRTLRYYDKMGLLSPSQYSETGYRLYTNADLLTLQNILALKFLGFSLEEIRLLLQAGPKRLEEVLAQQKAMMEEKRTQLDSIIHAIEETERLLQTHRCNWESIVRVIQVIQMGQQNDHWSAKYLTPEQLKTMEELHRKATTEETRQKFAAYHPNEWTEEDQKRVDEQYRFIKQELGRLVAQGADPASAEAQHVACIKQELGFGFSHGDPDIEASVRKWWEEYNALPEEQKPFDMSVYLYTSEEQDFLEKALAIYQQHQGKWRRDSERLPGHTGSPPLSCLLRIAIVIIGRQSLNAHQFGAQALLYRCLAMSIAHHSLAHLHSFPPGQRLAVTLPHWTCVSG